MRSKVFPADLSVLLVVVALLPTGCAAEVTGRSTGTGSSGGGRQTIEKSEMPEAPGSVKYSGSDAVLDASNAAQGYVMIRYTGSADKVQIQVTQPDGTRTPYPLEKGDYHAVPLSGGSGSYTIVVYAHISGSSYAVVLSQNIQVKLENEFGPFLYPDQYVEYTNDSQCVQYGRELSDKSADDLDYVTNVFNYVTGNIKYDKEKAADIPVNYLPDPDRTMESKKGICLDYASLMTELLRSQSIPAKLEVGYSGDVYHAWISVYLDERGWVDDIIRFDGKDWKLMDPTLAASNDIKSAGKYMRDESNYTLMYNY